MFVYTLKSPRFGSKPFRSTCRMETALFVALGYSVRKAEVLWKDA